MTLFSLWDLVQEKRIAEAKSNASDAGGQARDAVASNRDLHSRLNYLALINQSMWELLRDRMGVTEQDLIEKVREVDLRDGRADGKVRADLKKCAGCENVLSGRHLKCIYCGAPVTEGSVFDRV